MEQNDMFGELPGAATFKRLPYFQSRNCAFPLALFATRMLFKILFQSPHFRNMFKPFVLLVLAITRLSGVFALPSPSYIGSSLGRVPNNVRQQPPSFEDPDAFVPSNSCKSDCLEERLKDCDICFADTSTSYINTCKTFLNLLAERASSSEDDASTTDWLEARDSFRSIALEANSPRCSGFVLYVTKEPYSLQLPAIEVLWELGACPQLEKEFAELGEKDVKVTIDFVKEVRDRSGTRIPISIQLRVRSKSKLRADIVRAAIIKASRSWDVTYSNSQFKIKKVGPGVYLVLIQFNQRYNREV